MLVDLTTRAERAYDIAAAATDVGDSAKARRAWERMFLRLEQVQYLTERSDDAWCQFCTPDRVAESGWSGEMYCLDHFQQVLNQRAAAKADTLLRRTKAR